MAGAFWEEQFVGIRLTGAGRGTLLALIGSAVLVGLVLWAIARGVRTELNDTGPIRRIEKRPGDK